MARRFEREVRLQDNFTQVPHGLWTAPVSYGAKVLLGWLHSHNPSYLARLSNNRIRAELGCSGQVGQWIDELVDAGFLRVEKAGQANRFILLARPWEDLARRECNRPENGQSDQSAEEPDDYRPVTDRLPSGNQTKNGHIEEKVVDQAGDHLFVPSHEISQNDETSKVEVVPDWEIRFAQFWAIYPRKDNKKGSRIMFKNLSKRDQIAALEALPNHIEFWKADNRTMRLIPLPTTWLHGERWEDEIRYEAPKGKNNPVLENLARRYQSEHRASDPDTRQTDRGDNRLGRSSVGNLSIEVHATD
jgi:hypothetical protein